MVLSMSGLGSYIEWGVKILRDMISIPTINPPGDKYKEFAYFSRDLLKELGFRTEVIEVPRSYVERFYPEYASYPRYIVLGRLGDKSPVVHFNGHYDVVPPGSGWSVDPFGGEIRDGRIYGRGADDMKGGIAAFITATKIFIDRSRDFNGSIEVALVPDEEIGGESGTGYLVKVLGSRPSYVIVGEPSGSGTIWIGHRGSVWALIEIYGKQAHGSTPWLGVNAFEYMIYIAKRLLEEYRSLLETRRSIYEYDDPRGAKPTVTIGGEVRGGAKTNIVPGYYAFSVDRRLIPEERVEDAERELIDLVNKISSEHREVRVNIKITNRSPPALTDPGSKLVRLAREAVREALGIEPRTTICLGGLDMRYYTEAGIETITYGPGILGNAHITDEFLSVEEFGKAVVAYTSILKKILTQ